MFLCLVLTNARPSRSSSTASCTPTCPRCASHARSFSWTTAPPDGSLDEVRAYMKKHPHFPITVLRNETTRGKGYCVRKALAHANGDFAIVQDADLEYFPEDWAGLLEPLVRGETDVVYGSRKMRPSGPYPGRAMFDLALAIENTALWFCYGVPLTDVATCYKAFRTDLLRSLELMSDGFAFCPEVTCRLLSRGVPIVERPIRYLPRTRRDGKKKSKRATCSPRSTKSRVAASGSGPDGARRRPAPVKPRKDAS
ncbi:MAG: glycosyltransferase family 2 protein [Deltaproteobacteria bacterium]|nr:glycosyltransferase family 2 protein [Deltaproteobacteria bacterium]